ncbi:helix-turn-helix transcriptional regulator [Liberibacter sp. Z1]|nr:helix-turn-helix transcriptional regulator [Candidatus Liberibacter sp.]
MVVTPETIRHWKEVGARIREIRQLKGKDLKQMAIESNQAISIVSQFERGVRSTSINYALFLRNEYGISFDWIYDGEIIDRIYRDVIKKREFDPVEIGSRIKEIRKNKDMTQENFGHLVGLSSVGVGNIENGHRTPRVETALKMKKTLQRPLDWIYFGDEIILPKSAERLKKLFCF